MTGKPQVIQHASRFLLKIWPFNSLSETRLTQSFLFVKKISIKILKLADFGGTPRINLGAAGVWPERVEQ